VTPQVLHAKAAECRRIVSDGLYKDLGDCIRDLAEEFDAATREIEAGYSPAARPDVASAADVSLAEGRGTSVASPRWH
jgi:hypothetical protein